MPRNGALDATDRKLLELLAKDGRATLQELADQVGLRRPSVHDRVRRLEAHGVIKGYRADLDPVALDAGVVAFALVRIERKPMEDCLAACGHVAKALRRMPEVLEFHTIAGSDDALLKVRVADMAALERVMLREVSSLPGVGRVTTLVVLSTAFERPLQVPAKPAAKLPAKSKEA